MEKDVKKHINQAKRFLKNKYGSINEAWEVELVKYQTFLELFLRAQDELKGQDLITLSTRGETRLNPLISVLEKASIRLDAFTKQFGLSAYAESKINVAEEDADDFINALTSE